MTWLERKKRACWQMIAREYPQRMDKYGLVREWLARSVQPGDVVLDAGCGHETIPPSVPVTLIGFDYVHDDVKRNRALNLGLVAEMGAVPIQSDSVNVIVLNMVAEHLQHPERVFAELARILKPHGWLILMTPSIWNIVTIINRLIPNRWHPLVAKALTGAAESDTFPTFYRASSEAQLQQVIGPHLRLIDLQYFQPPPYAFVFSRKVCWLVIQFYHLLNRWDWLAPLRGVLIARYRKGAI
jgi:SAM-dependent methyltransferase